MTSNERTRPEVLSTPGADDHNLYLYSAPGRAGVHRRATRPDGTAVLTASGELDLDSVGCLRQALTDARNDGATRILLDLTAVTFGDSTFLNTLLTARNKPGQLILTGPLPDHLRHLFDLTGATRLFHIADDDTAA
ncbi:STAS domain-containing protein [Streptomyces sp. NPDC046371]|uniref:STAS domain-containing protein n=1 Tax=Streptomyces sp. NPDC046371 TaxID=3154916 RepID=UPI00340B897A